jgi:WD40 repeat protein
MVTVWDLHTRAQRSFCRGSEYEVFALAFRPDGMILASASRRWVHLWDVATGRLLLGLATFDQSVALAFSPDGHRIAVGGVRGFNEGGAMVWELEDHRGIQTLRGLLGPVERTIISPDGRLIAALSQDWQLGIWDRSLGRLLHQFDAPQGSYADNAALAFDTASRRLAYASGHEAVLWDIATGKVLKTWRMPEGFQDKLAFRADQLLSIRFETPDERVPPYGTDPKRYPRIVRARDLLSGDPRKPIWELREFNWHVFGSDVSPDGQYFLADGLRGPSVDKREHIVRLYDVPARKELRPIPVPLPVTRLSGSFFLFDPTGTVLVQKVNDDWRLHLLAVPDLTFLGEIQLDANSGHAEGIKCLRPGGKQWLTAHVRSGKTVPSTYTVHELGRDTPLLTIAADAMTISGNRSEFSRDGRIVTWCNLDGTVSVCDLVEVQRRLAEIGLGW